MSVALIGSSGNGWDFDANNNAYVRRGPPHFGASGGGYVVSGGSTAVVAAALGANTMLASARFSISSSRNMWITRIRALFVPATVGASGGVAGQISWQRFTAQTPTGGAARTPARKDASTGGGTDLSDVRDSNAALTGTAPTFGDIIAIALVPVFTTGGAYEWIMDLDEDEWIRLTAGDGIALRTQTAMAATQTWMYSYAIHYLEK